MTVLDDSNPPFYKWFTDGKLNVSYNCLDRHVEAGRGNRVAFHWAGEEGEQRAVTYAELHRDVQKLANALKDLGVSRASDAPRTLARATTACFVTGTLSARWNTRLPAARSG